MSWEILLLEEVEHWYFTLDDDAMTAVTGAIDLLEMEGPTLGRPTVDKVKGSKFHSMKGAAARGHQHPGPVHFRSATAGDSVAWR